MIDGEILVDFDGTLSTDTAQHKPYKPDDVGEPIMEMVNRVKRWLELGITVKIFTGRVADDPKGIARYTIQKWCEKYIGQVLEVTNSKDSKTFAIYDDRGVRVEKNTGKIVSEFEFHNAETESLQAKLTEDARKSLEEKTRRTHRPRRPKPPPVGRVFLDGNQGYRHSPQTLRDTENFFVDGARQ